MRNDLARRLVQRTDNREVDMNPEGLTTDQILKLNLTPDNWSLLLEIERESHNRTVVIAFAEAQLTAEAEVVEAKEVKEEVKPVSKKGKK